jgi:predicted PhzF superfamily epimerase YddE/YHI9
MTIPLFHVDAFTDRPFAGNPAAVCLLPSWQQDHWLQAVAGEMNLPMTAFLVKQADHFDLRRFTPNVEVDLGGHATLASAHILSQEGYATRDELRFSTKWGILNAVHSGDHISLDFPLLPEEAAEPPPGLLPALGVSARYVGKIQFGYLVELESEVTLRGLTPNFQQLTTVPMRGVIVTSTSADPQFDRWNRPTSRSPRPCVPRRSKTWTRRAGSRLATGVGCGPQ